jgi:hypothetical protein
MDAVKRTQNDGVVMTLSKTGKSHPAISVSILVPVFGDTGQQRVDSLFLYRVRG